MGAVLISGQAPPPVPDDMGSWRLAPGTRERTQGFVVSPFAHLPEADALFLHFAGGHGGAWLEKLRAACPVTDAAGQATPSAAIAFTWTGLEAMGLDAATLASFSAPFQEGMHQIDRQRRLSDDAGSGVAIAGGPLWSGNITPKQLGPADGPQAAPTKLTVHAVLLVYAIDTDALDALGLEIDQALAGTAILVVRRTRLSLRNDSQGRAREHFGFTDGISQPVPEGDAVVSKQGVALPPDRLHGIASGDLLMGHMNAQGEAASGPMVAAALDPAALLPADGAPQGFRNLGLDGSYLVVRELRQDVAAFWNAMYAASGGTTPDEAIALATRVVGRSMDGDMLIPGGTLAPVDGLPRNDFTYFRNDRHGLGCPIGAHVRRANPRDGLSPDDDTAPTLLQAAQNHRILRRGRKFGATIKDPRHDDGEERGLLFMCLNTDLVRQFEFVQQTWLLNQDFGTLLDETDPLLGPRGRFTIPAQPLRRRPAVETFVRFAGGEYFFLPSLPALDFLQALPARGDA